MDYNNNLTYIIFDTSELNQIDFSQVYETSANTVRLSVNGLKTFVKYSGTMPSSVVSLTTKEGQYTHDEMLVILQTPVWQAPSPF